MKVSYFLLLTSLARRLVTPKFKPLAEASCEGRCFLCSVDASFRPHPAGLAIIRSGMIDILYRLCSPSG
jgi:hypothetical protein